MEKQDKIKTPPTQEKEEEEEGESGMQDQKTNISPPPTGQGHDNEQQEEEDFLQKFECCVCLDLLYKPVVLACGHISCFWCVCKSMDVWQQSHCPICRNPYNHFPSVCLLLHFLLLKMYPIAYKRREREVGEEENKVGYYSPQFEHNSVVSHSDVESDVQSNCQHFPAHPKEKLSIESCFSSKKRSSSSEKLPKTTGQREDSIESVPSTPLRSSEGPARAEPENCSSFGTGLQNGTQKEPSVNEFLCTECNKLLFQPVVLNCGHVCCESCIAIPVEGSPRCKICQSLHPNGVPSVCFILEHFLEEHFPRLYAERREDLLNRANRLTQAQRTPATQPSFSPNAFSWILATGPKLHIGVGCDSCGTQFPSGIVSVCNSKRKANLFPGDNMCPIVGERYNCKDCVETIGFDLCEACHNNPPKVLGRFNQQHRPEHNFEVVEPQSIPELLEMMNLEQSDYDGSENEEDADEYVAAPTLSRVVPHYIEDGSNDVEDVSPASALSIDAELDHADYFDTHHSSYSARQ